MEFLWLRTFASSPLPPPPLLSSPPRNSCCLPSCLLVVHFTTHFSWDRPGTDGVSEGVCLEISSPSLRRAFPSRSLTVASFIFVGSLVEKNDSVRPYSSDTTGAAPHVTGNASVLEHGVCLKESSRRPGGSCAWLCRSHAYKYDEMC